MHYVQDEDVLVSLTLNMIESNGNTMYVEV